MPNVAPEVHTLPEPSWTQSDNNLLPRWQRYLAWHSNRYGNQEIERLSREIARIDALIPEYIRTIDTRKTGMGKWRKELSELEQAGGPSDDEIMAKYEAVITSPHVIGTRTDAWGCLVVLIDPRIDGAEDRESGVYEISYKSFSLGVFDAPLIDQSMRYYFQRFDGRVNTENHHGPKRLSVSLYDLGTNLTDALATYDIESAVDYFVARLRKLVRYFGPTGLQKKVTGRADQIPWQGLQVADPVRAIRLLHDACQDSKEDKIRDIKITIAAYERDIEDYQRIIRDLRKERREKQALIEQRKATRQKTTVDQTEAVRSLAYITALPGVIAIKFDNADIPVLHVRNSFVHENKRYDLGDFELKLTTETVYFGTVLNVKRTRVPLGGTYEAGWHGMADAFCFGNRNDEIMSAFYSGDLGHAVNVALGTMNTVNAGTYAIEGYFAEIPLTAVWTRHRRQRPRHKRKMLAAV